MANTPGDTAREIYRDYTNFSGEFTRDAVRAYGAKCVATERARCDENVVKLLAGTGDDPWIKRFLVERLLDAIQRGESPAEFPVISSTRVAREIAENTIESSKVASSAGPSKVNTTEIRTESPSETANKSSDRRVHRALRYMRLLRAMIADGRDTAFLTTEVDLMMRDVLEVQ